MTNRQPILPLAAGVLASLVVHIAVAAGFVALGDASPEVGPPDLAVTGLRTSEPRMVGKAARITVTVAQSRGKSRETSVNVRLYVDQTPLGERMIKPVALARGEAEVQFDYVAEVGGAHDVRAIVDEEDRILESNEANNEVTRSFRWLTPSTTSAADLVAVDLRPMEDPVAGRPVRLAARFANIGDRPAPPGVIVLSVDGEPVHRVSITEPLEPGGSFLLRQWLDVEDPGSHTIDAFIDAEERTPEPDENNNRLRRQFVWTPPPPKQVVLGQDEPSPVRINWISHQDYRKLLARRARFDQAMVQKTTEPQPVARVPVEPTPPTATPLVALPEVALATVSPSTLPTQTRRTEIAPVAVRPEVSRAPVEARVPELPTTLRHLPPLELVTDAAKIAPLEEARADVEARPAMASKIAPAEVLARTEPTASDTTRPAGPPKPPTPPQKQPRRPAEPAVSVQSSTAAPRPTAAPRDTREAQAVTRLGSVELQPGGVIARPGIRINTTRPRFGPIAARTSAPLNPDVQITFNPEGRVVRARFLKSTGYSNVDGPLLVSFYKWTASGEKFKGLKDPLTVEIHILLMDE